MADPLMSVRLPKATLDALRLLADLHDGSVAAEIRTAVEKHISELTSAPSFTEQIERKQRERAAHASELTARVLASAGARQKRER